MNTKCTATSSRNHLMMTRLVGGEPYTWCGFCGETPNNYQPTNKEN